MRTTIVLGATLLDHFAAPTVPLPKHRRHYVRSAALHVIALARWAAALVRAHAHFVMPTSRESLASCAATSPLAAGDARTPECPPCFPPYHMANPIPLDQHTRNREASLISSSILSTSPRPSTPTATTRSSGARPARNGPSRTATPQPRRILNSCGRDAWNSPASSSGPKMGSTGTSAWMATIATGTARPLTWRFALSDRLKPFDDLPDLARLQRALPNNQDPPTRAPQRFDIVAVSLTVALTLGAPECGVGHGRTATPLAVVHVPVTAVNEHNGPARRHNDIRLARQIGAV